MKPNHPARLFFAAALIYAVIRVGASVSNMRDFFLGSCYFLGGVCGLSIAFSVAEKTATSFAESWRARTFNACGILHLDGRPCVLPDGHRSTEHATHWVPGTQTAEGYYSTEHRERFDDTGDRTERRVARGELPKVTRSGEVAETPASK